MAQKLMIYQSNYQSSLKPNIINEYSEVVTMDGLKKLWCVPAVTLLLF